jgi:hypothetical protein
MTKLLQQPTKPIGGLGVVQLLGRSDSANKSAAPTGRQRQGILELRESLIRQSEN